MLYVVAAVQLELVDDVQRLVLNNIEVRVVAVTGHEISVLPVPFCVFHADILSGYHLTVEHELLCAELLVIVLDKAEDILHELPVLLVVGYCDAHELCSLDETIHADCEILAVDVYVSGVEEWEHAVLLELLEILIVCCLHLVT